MKTTCLGFSSVICCGLMLAPLLVQTDQIWAQSPEPATVQKPVVIAGNGQCSGPLQGPRADRPINCPPSPGVRIAEAR